MIIKGDIKNIFNLTTAASIWFTAAIGMAIGFEYYFLAIIGIIVCVLTPSIPHVQKIKKDKFQNHSILMKTIPPPMDSD